MAMLSRIAACFVHRNPMDFSSRSWELLVRKLILKPPASSRRGQARGARHESKHMPRPPKTYGEPSGFHLEISPLWAGLRGKPPGHCRPQAAPTAYGTLL